MRFVVLSLSSSFASSPSKGFVRRRWLRLGFGRETHLQPASVHPGEVRVLVVEDDEGMAQAIATGLRRARMSIDVALDGPSGLERALVNDYDVVVLDRDLPGLRGDSICERMMDAGRRARVLMLTAASTIDDTVDGLGIGADDYLTKPFAFAELVARIGALARRAQPSVPPVVSVGDLRVDTAKRRAWRRGQDLDLSPKEFGVLEILVTARGRVVATEELLERVWDEASDPFTTAVKVTVSRLRAKLGDPPVVETVARAGYRVAEGEGP
jgi:DNA-binding response OmpR family regulator